MRKTLVCAIVCVMCFVLAAGSASAYRSDATATGKACGFCHVDTGGGGPLTAAGEYYATNGTLPPAVPVAPTGLGATVISSTQVNLSWTDASSDETGFKVQRSASAAGPFTLISTTAANAATYSNTGLTASTTYYYRVCATNASGDSAFTSVVSATTQAPAVVVPAAPTGLAATAISSTQINLAWADASNNETGFKLERAAAAAGPFVSIATPAAGATTFSNTGLTASTTYYYRVCATNTAGSSAYSNVASATTQAPAVVVPAAPTGLAATAISSTQINLAWADASNNETGFKLERAAAAAGPFVGIATPAAGATTSSNTGLTASTTYYYRVCATNTAGSSAYSNVASATTQAPAVVVPAAPTGLAATAISSTQINLAWADASNNETGFKLERAAAAAGPFVSIATPAAGATTFSNTGLTASTTYYYRVCATNTAGSSAYSNVASATTQAPAVVVPAAPTGLAATAISSTQINLAWTDASNNETGFKLERSAAAAGPFVSIATPAAGATTFSNTGLTASTTYYYRVCATNTAGSSAYSNVASATTQAPAVVVPAAPTGLAATAISSTQINLAWTDASNNETGFTLERSAAAAGPFVGIATPAAGATTSSNTGLTASTTYYYRVSATNTAGDSAYSNVASATTQAPAVVIPAAPTGLAATAISSTQINLAWTDASNNETGFKLERSAAAAGPFVGIATPAAGATTFSNTGLTASTAYYYRVSATNSAGDSAYSNVASATTQAPAAVIPAAPTGLAATPVSSSQINLAWTDASNNETGFKLERSAAATGPFVGIAAPAAGATTYGDTGLTASTTYYYRICATNTAGDSAYSDVASATTSDGPVVPEVPAAPTSLAASVGSTVQIDLAWTDASNNETGFKVQRSASAAGPFVVVATLEAGVSAYSNTGLAPATTYYYRVCATNTAGDSGFSNVASATTLASSGRRPGAPRSLRAGAISSSAIVLEWRDGSNNEMGFKLERSLRREGKFVAIADLPAGASSYQDSGLAASTRYFYRVCAYNDAGSSRYSSLASATTPRARPVEDDDDDDDNEVDNDRDDEGDDDDDDDRSKGHDIAKATPDVDGDTSDVLSRSRKRSKTKD